MTPQPRPTNGTRREIRYAGQTKTLTVTVMFSWTREDVPELIMSQSSGPKDYVKNDAYVFMNANPTFNLVMLVGGNGVLFFLARTTDGCWFDITGKQVVVA